MRNENIKIGKNAPKAIRREVYAEAIRVIERDKIVYKLNCFPLCLILPCILWELDSFLDKTPQGEDWDQWDIPGIFPELTDDRIKSITRFYKKPKERDIQRIKVLREMLAEVQPIKREKQHN